MSFLEMLCITFKQKDNHKILVILQLFANLPWTIYRLCSLAYIYCYKIMLRFKCYLVLI